MGVKQALDNVTPLNLSEIMRKLGLNSTLTDPILREQSGGRCDVVFQETKVSGYPLTSLSSRAAKKAQVLQHYDEEYLWRKATVLA